MSYTVTDAEAAASGYPATGTDARAGNVAVIQARSRTYGYQLYNRRLGKAFFWYRYKRDAIAKLTEMKAWGLP